MTEDLTLVAIGQNVGPYRIDALLGWGGMGVVYRAWDRGRDRTVAIKLVAGKRSNEKTRRQLIEEARTAAGLSHPSICTVHEVGHLADQPFIVMEHVEGSTLAALLANGCGLPLDDACRYAAQVIHAVAYAHDCGIVHGDLKSSNIMIARDRRAKILDFGLAVRLTNPTDASDSGSTHSQEIPSGAGTVPYMAPELLRGRSADRRSDVWALGVLLHEMVAGRRPFRGATRFDLAAAILYEPPLSLPAGVPDQLRGVIGRCLLKHPGDRYRSAVDLAAAIKEAGWV